MPVGSRRWSRYQSLWQKKCFKDTSICTIRHSDNIITIWLLDGWWKNLNFLVTSFSPKSHLPENSKMLKMEENRICSLWKLFCNSRNVARLFPSTLYFLHFKETLQVLFKFNIFTGVVFNIQLGTSHKNTYTGYLNCFWHKIDGLE